MTARSAGGKALDGGSGRRAREGARGPWRARLRLPLALRLAWRDLRGGQGHGGLRGFAVFLACITLGVGAIAAVGAVRDALASGFLHQGRVLLGGDVSLSSVHRRSERPLRAWLAERGRLSEVASMRAMARSASKVGAEGGGAGERRLLVELKAVDRAYPLFGEMVLSGGMGLGAAIGDGRGVVVDPILLARLGLGIGDRLAIGTATFTIRASIAREPDRLTSRTAFGPRVMMSLAGLEATGLRRPGSLVRWRTRLALDGAAGPDGEQALMRFREALRTRFPEAGLQVRDRRDPAPAVRRAIERFGQFLTLVGLATLLVGGVGVANAVASHMERKRGTVAVFKALGASNGLVLRVFLAEILALAGLGVLAGLGLGALAPAAIRRLAGDALPIPLEALAPVLGPATLASGIAYGLLVALLFVLWPLGRAARVRPSVLFRGPIAGEGGRPGWRYLAAMAASLLALAALAILTAEQTWIAVWFCVGMVGLFAAFLGFAGLLRLLAGRLRSIRRKRRISLALALAAMSAPGALTRSVVLSLGAGLTLMVAISLTHASLEAELSSHVPRNAPSYFVLDIDKGRFEAFAALARKTVPGVTVSSAPMLRGRIIAMKGQPVEALRPPPDAEWVLRGDRGLTFSRRLPQGSRLVQGTWWPPDYEGPPIVSFAADIARAFGLRIGDTVTVNVLGRNLTARIHNLRAVDWESLAINFVMVFPPDTLKGAPYTRLATLRLPDPDDLAREGRMVQALAGAFPTLTFIRVRDALAAIGEIFAKVMLAVRIAGGLVLAAGALVLAGALATAERRRIHHAVVLKTLGATRRRVLAAHAVEYLILAASTALLAIGAGSLAAWLVVTRAMRLDFVFSVSAVAEAVVLALALTLAFGMAGTWRVLRAPSMAWLRAE